MADFSTRTVNGLKDIQWAWSDNRLISSLRLFKTTDLLSVDDFIYYQQSINTITGNFTYTPNNYDIILLNGDYNDIMYSDTHETWVKDKDGNTITDIEVVDDFNVSKFIFYSYAISGVGMVTNSPTSIVNSFSSDAYNIDTVKNSLDNTDNFVSHVDLRYSYTGTENITHNIKIYCRVVVDEIVLYLPIPLLAVSYSAHANLVPNTLSPSSANQYITINNETYVMSFTSDNNTITWALPTPNLHYMEYHDTYKDSAYTAISSTQAGVDYRNNYIKNSNQLMAQIAYMGLYVQFTNDNGDTLNYLGEMVDGGYTTGNLLSPENWDNSINKNSTKAERDVSHEKPIVIDDSDDIDDMELGHNSYDTGFTKYYQCTIGNLDAVSNALSQQTVYTDLARNIVSLKAFVINTSNYVTSTNNEVIKIGSLNTQVTAPRILTFKSDLTIGTYTIFGKFGTSVKPHFLDKSPYTKIELYIPFCGTVTLPDFCMYKTITVNLLSDILTGACCGVVKCGGNIVAQKSGVIGVDVAITSTDNALKTNALIGGVLQGASLAGKGVTSAVTKNPVGIYNSVIAGIENVNNMRMSENANYTNVVGVTGDRTENAMPDRCYIKIYRPVINNDNTLYAHRFGKPCNKTEKLTNLSGFTQCFNPDINGNMTNREKEIIKEHLSKGVYL